MVQFISCILFTLYTISIMEAKKSMTIQLDPDEVIESLKSLVSSQYMKDITKGLAAQAAIKFKEELKKEQQSEEQVPEIKMPVKRKKIRKRPPGRALPEKSLAKKSLPKMSLPNKPLPERKLPVKKLPKRKLPMKRVPKKKSPGEAIPELPETQYDLNSRETQGAEATITTRNDALSEDYRNPQDEEENLSPMKEILDEQVAMSMIKEPAPDGDDFFQDSLEQDINNTPPPVTILPQKINGRIMRRLLEHLKKRHLV